MFQVCILKACSFTPAAVAALNSGSFSVRQDLGVMYFSWKFHVHSAEGSLERLRWRAGGLRRLARALG